MRKNCEVVGVGRRTTTDYERVHQSDNYSQSQSTLEKRCVLLPKLFRKNRETNKTGFYFWKSPINDPLHCKTRTKITFKKSEVQKLISRTRIMRWNKMLCSAYRNTIILDECMM